MGFIIWYKLEFKTEQAAGLGTLPSQANSLLSLGTTFPLTVSNDVFSGKYILDADITLMMLEGATADSFTLALTNLPLDVAEELQKKQRDGMSKKQYLLVDIYLGYFDDNTSGSTAKKVMTGVVTYVKNAISGDGLLETVVKGQEIGGYKLRTKCNVRLSMEEATADEIVREIISDTGVSVANDSHLDIQPQPFKDYTLRASNALNALKRFTDDPDRGIAIPLAISDNTLYIGPSVGRETAIPLEQETNIIRLDQKQDSDQSDPCGPDPLPSYDVTVLGHPALRVGQLVTLKLDKPPSGTLRINQVIHNFSTRSGYTCALLVVTAERGKVAREQTGANAFVGNLRGFVEGAQSQFYAIDVGQVTGYTAGNQQKHQATLNNGIAPSTNSVVPSVEATIDNSNQLRNKPIVAPFAWHKCGLIVPVYEGMRALLAHQRGLANDALITGFLWSDEPQHVFARPQSKDGDYWLCLPTELDGSTKQPTGKGVNDLTDKSGLRTIQAKGLHIFVGDQKLPEVGERPEAAKSQTIVIEHESGAKITIDTDGSVQIAAAQGKEISFTNGSVTLKLGSSGIEVS